LKFAASKEFTEDEQLFSLSACSSFGFNKPTNLSTGAKAVAADLSAPSPVARLRVAVVLVQKVKTDPFCFSD
jgi:hypothetical protein